MQSKKTLKYWYNATSGFSVINPTSTLFTPENPQAFVEAAAAPWRNGRQQTSGGRKNSVRLKRTARENCPVLQPRQLQLRQMHSHQQRRRKLVPRRLHSTRRGKKENHPLVKIKNTPIVGITIKDSRQDENPVTLFVDLNVRRDNFDRFERDVRASLPLPKLKVRDRIQIRVRQNSEAVPGPHFGGTDDPAAFCELHLNERMLHAVQQERQIRLSLQKNISERLLRHFGVPIDRYYLRFLPLLGPDQEKSAENTAVAAVLQSRRQQQLLRSSTAAGEQNCTKQHTRSQTAVPIRRQESAKHVTWAEITKDLPTDGVQHQGEWLMERKRIIHTSQNRNI